MKPGEKEQRERWAPYGATFHTILMWNIRFYDIG